MRGLTALEQRTYVSLDSHAACGTSTSRIVNFSTSRMSIAGAAVRGLAFSSSRALIRNCLNSQAAFQHFKSL